jgi:hypothetical protein
MFTLGDKKHINAMQKKQDSKAMNKWFAEKQASFKAL